MKNSTLKILIQKSTGLLCLVLLLLSANSNSVLLIDYQIRKAAYEEACENKAKPELKCHGKCHLTQSITQNLEQESTSKTLIGFEINSKVQPKSPSVSILKLELSSLYQNQILALIDLTEFSFSNQIKSSQNYKEINTPPPRFS